MLAPILAATLTFALPTDVGGPVPLRSLVAAEQADHIVIRGAADRDDTLVIELPVAAKRIDYDGGAGGFDALELRGGSARVQRVTQLTPHDGIIEIDGLTIRYFNLEPITDTAPAANYTINGTPGMDTVTFSDGPGGTTTVSSPTFESVTFANKTNVVFDGQGGGDTVLFNNPNPATGLASLVVLGVVNVTQSAPVRYPSFAVAANNGIALNTSVNDVDRLELTTQTGDMAFLDADDLRIGEVSGLFNGLTAVTTGSIDVRSNGGTITVPWRILAGAAGGDITLQALGASSDVIFTNDFPPGVAQAPAGSIAVEASRDIILLAGADLTAGVDLSFHAGRDIRISNSAEARATGNATAVVDSGGFIMGTVPISFDLPFFRGTDTLVTARTPAGVSITGVLGGTASVTIQSSQVEITQFGLVEVRFGLATFETDPTAPHIDLGPTTDLATDRLELSDEELDRVDSLDVHLRAPGGTISVTSPITFTRHIGPELTLSAGNLVTATGAGSITMVQGQLTFEHLSGAPMGWTITPSSVQMTGGAPVPYSNVTILNAIGSVGAGGGNDTFVVAPSPSTTINVDGNLPAPPALPGDTLDFELAGVTAPVLNATATPSGYQGSLTSANRQPVNFSDIETIVDAPGDLSIAKSDGLATATAGTPVTYTITVTNLAATPFAGVTVTDVMPAQLTGVTWTCTPSVGSTCTAAGSGDINDVVAIAANGTLTYSVTGTISPGASGTLTNTATVASPSDINPANNSATDTTAITAQADLIVTKSGPAGTPFAGDTLTYTITLRNAGPSSAQNVSLTDAIPANTTFVSLTAAPGYTCTTPPAGGTGTVTCTRAVLAPSTTADTFTLVVDTNGTAPGGTAIANTATATTTTPGDNPSNSTATATTTIGAQSDLIVTKSGPGGTTFAGGELTYTITLRNAGPSDAQSVTLTDAIPTNTRFVSFTAAPGYTCATPAAGGTGTVTCTRAVLPPSPAADTFTLTVRVDRPLAAGAVITNTATATTTTPDPAANNSATAPAVTVAEVNIPTLSEWMLLLLAAMLAFIAMKMAK